jgi:uncharacterized membrane protein YcaP (DUF421 family)
MLLLVFRTLIVYALTMLSMKVMGKRQIGQLQPFELVVVLIISELATICLENNGLPLLNSIIPIVTITILQITIALINMKSQKFRILVCGKPTVIIKNGEILEDEMKRLRLNTSDLQEQLRAKGFFDLAEVEFAIMETNGQLSVMPRADKRPLNPGDLNLKIKNEKPAVSLILDGVINYKHLAEQERDERWLYKKLRQYNIEKPEDVFFLSLDGNGNIFCQLKAKADSTGNPPPIREDKKTAPPGSGQGTMPATAQDIKKLKKEGKSDV